MNRVVQNYLYNLGYQLLTLILPFLTIPYLTRTLGPKNLGIESYTSSIIAIYIAFATIGTNIYGTRQIASLRDDINKLKIEAYNLFIVRTVIASVVLMIFLIFSIHSRYPLFLELQIFFFIGSSLIDCTWYFFGKERFKEITIRNLLIKIIGFIFILVFVKNKNDLGIYILINGFTLFIPNIYFLFKFLKEIGKPQKIYFSYQGFLFLFKNLLPFFVMAVITQIYTNVDKVIIENMNLTYQLGVYSQLLKTYNVFLAPITAIGTILMPYVSNLNSKNNKNSIDYTIKISTNIIFLIGFAIFFGFISISRQFVLIYFGKNLLEYVNLFRIGCILILTGSISNIVIQQVVFPNMQESIYVKGLVYATVIKVSSLFILIKSFNIYAPLISYIISEIFILIWSIYKTRKSVDLISVLFNKNNIKIILSGLMMPLCLYFFNLNIFWNGILGSLIYFIALFLLKEDMVLKILIFLRTRIKDLFTYVRLNNK